jgi:uncharacterized membrane protein (DUF4010 family)
MDLNTLYGSLGLSLGIGLLIGLQREQSAAEEQLSQEPRPTAKLYVGGIRTYPLFALAGSLSVLLSRQFGPWTLVLAFAALVTPLAIAYADDVKAGRDRGLTSEVAFIVTFLLGALATSDGVVEPAQRRWLITASIGVVVTGLLSLKRPLHEVVKKVSREDIYATVKFAVVAIIALPLLPDIAYGPEKLKVLNPHKIGWMVMLIAGISFIGYVSIRVLGPGKGLGVTGLVGGLASSTAVTLAFSGRSKEQPAVAHACALGVVLACTIMPIRVIASVAVVNPALVRYVALPMGGLALGGLLSGLVIYLRGEKGKAEGEVKLTNPFELSSALKFGLMFAGILFIAKAATLWGKSAGIYLAGILAGTTDVDAITLSMANLVKEVPPSTTPAIAATTILLATASNTFVKAGMALSLGAPGFRGRVATSFATMLVFGGIGAAVLWLA